MLVRYHRFSPSTSLQIVISEVNSFSQSCFHTGDVCGEEGIDWPQAEYGDDVTSDDGDDLSENDSDWDHDVPLHCYSRFELEPEAGAVVPDISYWVPGFTRDAVHVVPNGGGAAVVANEDLSDGDDGDNGSVAEEDANEANEEPAQQKEEGEKEGPTGEGVQENQLRKEIHLSVGRCNL